MFFVKITNLLSINIPLIKCSDSIIVQDLSFSHEFLRLSGRTKTLFYYLILMEYDHMLITYAYMNIFVMLNCSMSIDYVKSLNSIVDRIINPGLLIFRVYVLLYIKSLSILILEVSACNLNAFSLYYWFGFQLIRIRNNYYNTNRFHDESNTAYILMNTKASSKNILRRYFL
uniref:hypothetical protein n=1 Tax=Pachymeniopsis lanceolata TaxID=151733 RepID=UPI002A834C81|nr:hypothetical protein UYL67_pgp107 [Pachymeniopsis lanceolata]WOL37231.1 hypothetical protein [Pachymeniopsis lanceolata]